MKESLKALISKNALSEADTHALFEAMFSDDGQEISDAQIGAYLYSTGSRQITAQELVGAAKSMREHVSSVRINSSEPLLDTCGTGGSGLNTFSTSTACAFVVVGAGQAVAKHGNRAATSQAGSADVLAALGVNLDLSPQAVATCVEETGFGFMFAPHHHPATKRVVGIRRELGFRTIFNFLGPLVNPAGAEYQLMGISRQDMVPVMAEALRQLGAKHALVVHGLDGLDEISLAAETDVSEVVDGHIRSYQISPEAFGFAKVSPEEIVGAEASTTAGLIKELFNGALTPYRDLVLLNAGAALYVSGKADSIANGVQLAARSIDQGRAAEVLKKVISFTNQS